LKRRSTIGWFAKNDKFVDGGSKAVASTDFRDSPKGLFGVPPKCYMHKQASFIPSFFPDGTKLGKDADFFYFPPYASHPELGKPVEGAGTLVAIAKDSKAARVIEFLQMPIAHEVWMAQSGFLTPYKGVNTEAYANDTLRKEGEVLLRHDLPLRRFRPDARQDRRWRLLDRHGRLCQRQVLRSGRGPDPEGLGRPEVTSFGGAGIIRRLLPILRNFWAAEGMRKGTYFET
jgi:hypothetical protein